MSNSECSNINSWEKHLQFNDIKWSWWLSVSTKSMGDRKPAPLWWQRGDKTENTTLFHPACLCTGRVNQSCETRHGDLFTLTSGERQEAERLPHSLKEEGTLPGTLNTPLCPWISHVYVHCLTHTYTPTHRKHTHCTHTRSPGKQPRLSDHLANFRWELRV